jgi:hypothetical protein
MVVRDNYAAVSHGAGWSSLGAHALHTAMSVT